LGIPHNSLLDGTATKFCVNSLWRLASAPSVGEVRAGGSRALVRERPGIRRGPGDILVIKAGEVHPFLNTGDPLKQEDVHLSPRFIQENLE